MSTTSIDKMAKEINKALDEYASLEADKMKKCVKSAATFTKKEIQANAPVRTGAYKKSWTTKKTAEKSNSITMTVYSKDQYRLAHLLENGHAKRGGGRVQGHPHIKPAEEKGAERLEELIKKEL